MEASSLVATYFIGMLIVGLATRIMYHLGHLDNKLDDALTAAVLWPLVLVLLVLAGIGWCIGAAFDPICKKIALLIERLTKRNE